MLDASEAKQSPIMEGLQALLAGTAADRREGRGPAPIVIASDLIQNSDAMSFYAATTGELQASPEFARLARNLDELKVHDLPRAAPPRPRSTRRPSTTSGCATSTPRARQRLTSRPLGDL